METESNSGSRPLLLVEKTSNQHVNDVTALLLAAGRSRRMGAFKPLLPFGDKTVIEHCIAQLHAAGIDDIIVVVGHRAEEVRQQLKVSNVRFALNPDPDSEMSASIKCGVEQLDEEAKAVLIALVDHPAVPSEIIRLIIAEWRTGAKIIQPAFGTRGGHPVLVDLSYRDELLSLNPERGLRSWFDEHRHEVLRLPVASPFVARDMDTWDDYCDLHRAVFGREPSQT
jgi:molybdenum cofactor cytidylyltransferase